MGKLSRRRFVQFGAAAGVGLGVGGATRARAEVTGSSQPPAAPVPWIVMLYLAGDNNLTEDMVLALQDLQAEGPLGDDPH